MTTLSLRPAPSALVLGRPALQSGSAQASPRRSAADEPASREGQVEGGTRPRRAIVDDRRRESRVRRAGAAAGALLMAQAGCAHVPPRRLSQDRFEYGEVLAESWKRQTLSNIVRLRYGDAPTFLDVTSVISTYSATVDATGGGFLAASPAPSSLSLGASASFSNTPTVTFQPLAGQKFTASLLRPLPPSAVFQMIQAGWPVPLILRTALRSVNRLWNQALGTPADPGFDDLVGTLDRLQRSRALSIRVEERKGGESTLVVLHDGAGDDSAREAYRRVRELLQLREGASEFAIAFGPVPQSDLEIAVVTRSMLEIMLEIASGVEVPAADLAEGRALSAGRDRGSPPAEPLIRIRSGRSRPDDAFVAVPYRGLWFWIDDTNPSSKGRFTFLMILSSLADSDQRSAGPLVTVSAGR